MPTPARAPLEPPSARGIQIQCPCAAAALYQVTETSVCLGCRHTVGAQSARSTRLDRHPLTTAVTAPPATSGYVQHEPSAARFHALRHMTPLSYRALHFCLHSVLLGLMLTDPEQVLPPLAMHQPHAARHMLAHLRMDVQVLQQLLAPAEDSGCLDTPTEALALIAAALRELLTALPTETASAHALSTAAARDAWEEGFARIVDRCRSRPPLPSFEDVVPVSMDARLQVASTPAFIIALSSRVRERAACASAVHTLTRAPPPFPAGSCPRTFKIPRRWNLVNGVH